MLVEKLQIKKIGLMKPLTTWVMLSMAFTTTIVSKW
jgi:hypothetical protein